MLESQHAMFYKSNLSYVSVYIPKYVYPDGTRLVGGMAAARLTSHENDTHTNTLESHLVSQRAAYTVFSSTDTLPPLVPPEAWMGPPCATFQLGCSSPPPSSLVATGRRCEVLLIPMTLLVLRMGSSKPRAFCFGVVSFVAMKKNPQARSTTSKEWGGERDSRGRGCRLTTRSVDRRHSQRASDNTYHV